MSQGLTTTQPLPQLPAHLQRESGAPARGTELLSKYVVPPRIKIVQQLKLSELFQNYPEGTALMVMQPQMQIVAEMQFNQMHQPTQGKPFYFCPLFFYPEFCIWNPLKARGQLPTIRDRSTDPDGQIARMARTPGLREQVCPEMPEEKITFNEHLNFIVIIIYHDNPEVFKPALISFVRGEHRTGRKLAEWITARRADMFGCVFQAFVEKHKNTKGQNWYGFNIDNPAEISPWIEDAAIFGEFERLHVQYRDNHKQGLLQASYDDDDLATVPAAAVQTSKEY